MKIRGLSLEDVYDISLRNEGYFRVCMYSYSKRLLRKKLRKECKKEGTIVSFKGVLNGEFLYKVDLKALKAKRFAERLGQKED